MLHVKPSAQTDTAAPHCGSHCHPAARILTLHVLLLQLGKRMSDSEIQEAMLEMDGDGGGEVEYPEFLAWWSSQASKSGGEAGSFAQMLKYGTDLGNSLSGVAGEHQY